SATPVAPITPPSAPQNLQATPGNGSVALAWGAPSSLGGAASVTYTLYRSTSSGTETLLQGNVSGTTFTDSTASNGPTYYYKVSASNSAGEGPLSNEASAAPNGPVPPLPLSILDDFNRPNQDPLSAGNWGDGILGNSERSLRVVSSQCGSDRTSTATGWWKTQVGPTSEAYATVATLPGNNNAMPLYVRLQSPGSSAADGYVLVYNQLSGTDQVLLYRMTNGALTQIALASREVAVGNTLLLRASGTTLESWIRVGTTW